jgi:coproporphyrinogen III oxidase
MKAKFGVWRKRVDRAAVCTRIRCFTINGADADSPNFTPLASSLVSTYLMANPCAVHMNTGFLTTGRHGLAAARGQIRRSRMRLVNSMRHSALLHCITRHIDRFKKWADDYFYISPPVPPRRGRLYDHRSQRWRIRTQFRVREDVGRDIPGDLSQEVGSAAGWIPRV